MAQKVLYKIFKKYKIDDKKIIKFCVKECTQHSKKKTYYYIGKKELLKKPIKVNINGNEII